MAKNFCAVYDANVLYPATLRDLLISLTRTGLFSAKWTEAIHEEWITNLLKDRPDLKREQLDRTKMLMNKTVRDCVVEGYEPLIPALNLPDGKDRHVLAAAIMARADVIVTYNLRDFPLEETEKYGIEAQHPDEFISHQIDLNSGKVLLEMKKILERLKNPPVSPEEYLENLSRLSLVETCAALQKYFII